MNGVIKRCAVFNDLTGFGRCALSVSMPVLSALGVQACPAPTAVLSAHPRHPGHTFLDMTPALPGYLAHWSALGLAFDGVLVGYLTGTEQTGLAEGFIREARGFGSPRLVIDPVMGDNGRRYNVIPPDMTEGMRGLCRQADFITPNLTEACMLASVPFPEGAVSEGWLDCLLRHLRRVTAAGVIIKGVPFAEGPRNVLYQDDETAFWPYAPVEADYPGCGDFFAAVFTGRLLLGDTPGDAFLSACQWTEKAVLRTYKEKTPPEEGLLFEGLL